MSEIKSFSILKILQLCRVNGCCYVCCNQFCNWWIYAGELNMIGCFNFTEQLAKNAAANAPIIFEEIVVVVVNIIMNVFFELT